MQEFSIAVIHGIRRDFYQVVEDPKLSSTSVKEQSVGANFLSYSPVKLISVSIQPTGPQTQKLLRLIIWVSIAKVHLIKPINHSISLQFSFDESTIVRELCVESLVTLRYKEGRIIFTTGENDSEIIEQDRDENKSVPKTLLPPLIYGSVFRISFH